MWLLYVLALMANEAVADDHSDTEPAEPPLNAPMHLYFAAPDHSSLLAEEKIFPHGLTPLELGRAIVEALIDGPRGNLMRTLPEKTRLSAFYIAENGTAYVDFDSTIRSRHPGGCRLEQLTVYAIVNSLVVNIDLIKSVKILIGGGEAETLAGHIDTRFPFRANMLIIR